jgi:hypothetical protein
MVRAVAKSGLRWSIEVTTLYGDEGLVGETLLRVGYELHTTRNGQIQRLELVHPKYGRLESADQVRNDGKLLTERLQRFSDVERIKFGIELGAILSHQSDGSVRRILLAEVNVVLGPATMSATATLSPNPAQSEEERRRLVEEAATREAERKRNASIRRATVAIEVPKALEVMELMCIPEPTTTELGHIVDIVKDESGGRLDKYAAQKQIERFTRSINHPTVFGLGARHAVSNEIPPPRPMDMAEAKAFALGIGAAWLAECERD